MTTPVRRTIGDLARNTLSIVKGKCKTRIGGRESDTSNPQNNLTPPFGALYENSHPNAGF